MGTNGTGCSEWERDFDPKTEQPKNHTFDDAQSSQVQRAERLRLELEKIAWMDEFLDDIGVAKEMMRIAREAVQADEDAAQPPAAPVETNSASASSVSPVGFGDDGRRCQSGLLGSPEEQKPSALPPSRSSAGTEYQLKPPFDIYHDGMQIGDAEGHLCSAESPEIANAILSALNNALPQALPVTQNAAVLAERLIQTAVDYESGRCGKREMAEARAAVEAAIGLGSVK